MKNIFNLLFFLVICGCDANTNGYWCLALSKCTLKNVKNNKNVSPLVSGGQCENTHTVEIDVRDRLVNLGMILLVTLMVIVGLVLTVVSVSHVVKALRSNKRNILIVE